MASQTSTEELQKVTLTGVISSGKELGRGGYGRVFAVDYHGTPCAAKEILPHLLEGVSPQRKEAMKNHFIRECIRCSDIRHPKIVLFLGVYYSSEKSEFPVMVMELMDNSLNYFIEDNQSNIPLKTKLSILHDVSLGLSCLHGLKPPLIHRDLSSNNILLTDRLVAKISDLGMAKMIHSDSRKTKSRLTSAPGTLHFTAPEALDDLNPVYGTPVDVFSFGSVSLHIFCEQWPTPSSQVIIDAETKQLVALSEVRRRQAYFDKMGEGAGALRPLTEKCLANDPNDRPAIKEVSKVIAEAMGNALDTGAMDIQPHKKNVDPPPDAKSRKIQRTRTPKAEVKKVTQPPEGAAVTKANQPHPNMETLSLVEALQTQQYHLKWTKCADIPKRMYDPSVAIDGNNVYVTAGSAPEYGTKNNVYRYDTSTDQWHTLPLSGHRGGVLCVVDKKLSIFGGSNPVSKQRLNKVSTYNGNTRSWTSFYPSMIYIRYQPGVVAYSDHVIAMGGSGEAPGEYLDTVEVMNWWNRSPWMEVTTRLPVPMWDIKPTVADENLLILGYGSATGQYMTSYKIPVSNYISKSDDLTQSSVQWKQLFPAPYYFSATVPCSHPPMIIGGSDASGTIPTADIRFYDASKRAWLQVDLLTSPRIAAGVATIDNHTIIVIGGNTKGGSVEGATTSSLGLVEIGRLVPK